MSKSTTTAASTAKKVGGAAPVAKNADASKGGDTKEKKIKAKKAVFEVKNAQMVTDGKTVTALNDEGKLVTGMPVGFAFTSHKPLSKKVFGSTGHFLAHRAELLKFKGANLVAQGTKLAEKAEQYIKAGGDKNAKVIKKAEKAAASMAELAATLAESGLDINAILAKAVADRKEKAAAEATPAK